jgi:hypothetical protein
MANEMVQAQQAPPAVAIPPVTATVLMGGYDPRDGTLRALNLDTLRQLQALVERLYCLDRLDERQRVEAVIKAGAAVGGVLSEGLRTPSESPAKGLSKGCACTLLVIACLLYLLKPSLKPLIMGLIIAITMARPMMGMMRLMIDEISKVWAGLTPLP